MTDIQALRSQQYSDNLELLSQQMTPKVADYCMQQSATGSKAFRMLSQVDGTNAVERSTSAKPAMNIDIPHDGRWVYPRMFDWGKVVDDIDLLQTNITPQGAYTRSAIAAMNRKRDDLFFEAYFGDAKTGETGSTTTSFDSNNQVANTVGSTTGLNLTKLREAIEGLEANDVGQSDHAASCQSRLQTGEAGRPAAPTPRTRRFDGGREVSRVDSRDLGAS